GDGCGQDAPEDTPQALGPPLVGARRRSMNLLAPGLVLTDPAQRGCWKVPLQRGDRGHAAELLPGRLRAGECVEIEERHSASPGGTCRSTSSTLRMLTTPLPMPVRR